jgi:hypothetical protein
VELGSKNDSQQDHPNKEFKLDKDPKNLQNVFVFVLKIALDFQGEKNIFVEIEILETINRF